jgi:hypothetical protein
MEDATVALKGVRPTGLEIALSGDEVLVPRAQDGALATGDSALQSPLPKS